MTQRATRCEPLDASHLIPQGRLDLRLRGDDLSSSRVILTHLVLPAKFGIPAN